MSGNTMGQCGDRRVEAAMRDDQIATGKQERLRDVLRDVHVWWSRTELIDRLSASNRQYEIHGLGFDRVDDRRERSLLAAVKARRDGSERRVDERAITEVQRPLGQFLVPRLVE